MFQMRPTATTATKAREALAAVGIRANVKRCNFSTRVVILGDETAKLIGVAALATAGFRGPANSDLFFNQSADGRHEVFAYEVRA